MTTPNEQPVSDTPRTDKAYQTWTRIYGAIAVANEANKHGKQLERELNQANRKLDGLTELHASLCSHHKNIQFIAELEAVARAADVVRKEFFYFTSDSPEKQNLVVALESLKAKGWKA